MGVSPAGLFPGNSQLHHGLALVLGHVFPADPSSVEGSQQKAECSHSVPLLRLQIKPHSKV